MANEGRLQNVNNGDNGCGHKFAGKCGDFVIVVINQVQETVIGNGDCRMGSGKIVMPRAQRRLAVHVECGVRTPISDRHRQGHLSAGIGNIATLDATGQVIDSGDLLSEYAKLIGTPINGNLACTDALGQVFDCGSAPADYLTVVKATSVFDSAGLGVPMVDAALAGVDVPVAPADGYRVFVTAADGAFVEGKIYQYYVGTGYDGGASLNDGYILQVKGTTPDFIIGGTALTDWVRLSDVALDSSLESLIADTVDITSDTIPVDPGATGYRVFMTSTDTTYEEGKVYTWDDDTNTWDSGVLLAEGQFMTTKGSSPDMIVGGTDPTDYEALSEKLDRNSLACKDITVAISADTGTAVADPNWIDAYYLSASPVSGADKVVASVVIAGDGTITVTLAAVSTAEAVYRVCAILD